MRFFLEYRIYYGTFCHHTKYTSRYQQYIGLYHNETITSLLTIADLKRDTHTTHTKHCQN